MSKPKKWNKEDVDWLVKNYNKPTKEKAEYLNRSMCAILTKQHKLGLKKDLKTLKSGMKINYWLLKKEFIKNRATHWTCVCECGKIKNISRQSLVAETSKSCGCLAIKKKTLHDLSYDKIYKTWQGIKCRCYNKNNSEYQNYGARGIKIFSKWKNNPKLFCDYVNTNLGNRPIGHSLDRINNNGNYAPGNLRWSDQKTQIRNSRTTKLLEKDVIEIKKDLLNNISVKSLSIKYSVSLGAINGIKYGHNWKGVN